jgi:ribosome-associated translation inhibitor RaiA
MEVTFFQKNLTKREEKSFTDYLQGKTDAIENLLTKFATDARLLKASIEKFEKHDAYEVELCLVLPTKSILGKEASHSITKAVDLAKDRLVIQIKKHLQSLRKGRTHKSIRESEVVEEKIEETMYTQ